MWTKITFLSTKLLASCTFWSWIKGKSKKMVVLPSCNVSEKLGWSVCWKIVIIIIILNYLFKAPQVQNLGALCAIFLKKKKQTNKQKTQSEQIGSRPRFLSLQFLTRVGCWGQHNILFSWPNSETSSVPSSPPVFHFPFSFCFVFCFVFTCFAFYNHVSNQTQHSLVLNFMSQRPTTCQLPWHH